MNTTDIELPEADTLTIKDFFTRYAASLTIPNYQRPYKWSLDNVLTLIDDVKNSQLRDAKVAYRIGSIVLHAAENEHNIVDGQQRITTLILILYAFIEQKKEDYTDSSQVDEAIKKAINDLVEKQLTFTEEISKFNLKTNYTEIKNIIKRRDFTEEHVSFLLNMCELAVFSLGDISESFQFFDSQNSRGKPLDTEDLLKAFHLREFEIDDNSIPEESNKLDKSVQNWESSKDKLSLGVLFKKYLHPIQCWSQNESKPDFTKSEAYRFKGVTPKKHQNYPYAKTVIELETAHENDPAPGDYPYQSDQKTVNGYRFFEMIEHYRKKIQKFTDRTSQSQSDSKDGKSNVFLNLINTYEQRHRKGDIYVRNLFDCALFYYEDKFGTDPHYHEQAIEYIFYWAYSIRIMQYSVKIESINNYVRENNLFFAIKHANTPFDIFKKRLLHFTPPESKNKTAADLNKEFNKLFKEKGLIPETSTN